MSLPLTPSPIEALEARLNVRWANIAAARDLAVQTRAALKRALIGLDSEDSSVVVSGSLARDEFTLGSDIDWSLLIDGQADPNVIDMLRESRISSRAWQENRQAARARSAR